MLILRMRQAETALKDGRLDEAFDLARAADVRMHRRGQDLIGRLARALVGRGREHLTAGRLPLASTDCDKAAALAGNLAEVAELKSAVAEAAAAKQERDRRHAGAIGAARQRIHDGELSIGQRCLEGIDGTMRVDVLQGEAVARRQEAETLLARGEDALQREDWAGAVEALAKARELHSANSSLTDLIARACTGIAACVRLALNQGRLDQASHLLDVAAPLCGRSVEFAELHGAYEMCVKSAGVVARGECRRAIEVLQRLRTVLPDAAWIAEAVADAQRAAESIERLRGGPLGLLLPDSVAAPGGRIDVHADAAAARTVVVASPAEPRRAPRPPVESGGAAPAGLPRRLMLHVDGVGSFLLVRERCVTLGAAGGSHQPDVPLTMDGSIAPVTIERIDDDYFLIGSSGVTVNNVAVTRRLLRDGDRIALSARCHIRFAVPNAASTSAVLSIAGARIPGTDATRVVLLDRSLVLGPGAAAHVRADDLAEPAVVHVRDGRLFCNAAQEVTVNGHPIDRQAGLPLGAQLRLGPLSMVVKSA